MLSAWRRLNPDFRARGALAALVQLAYAPPMLGLLIVWWPFGEDALAYFAPLRGWAGTQRRAGAIPLGTFTSFAGSRSRPICRGHSGMRAASRSGRFWRGSCLDQPAARWRETSQV